MLKRVAVTYRYEAKVRPYADELVCLATPELFYAVSQFYRHFPQVEDEEVVSLLKTSPTPRREQYNA